MVYRVIEKIYNGFAKSALFNAGNERLIIIWNNGEKSEITGKQAIHVNKLFRQFIGE